MIPLALYQLKKIKESENSRQKNEKFRQKNENSRLGKIEKFRQKILHQKKNGKIRQKIRF